MSYTGKILTVNLSTGNIRTEHLDSIEYRKFLGGRGLVAYYVFRHTNADTHPFSEENPLVFATGILTGAMIAGSGRHSVGTLSPLTNTFTSAEAGGFWGVTLKRTGYDAVVITGRASQLSYLFIGEDTVSLHSAEQWRGEKTTVFQEAMKQIHGDKCHVAQCGPAAEKLIPFSCVVHDLRHFAGRGGIGAVMGWKNIRGIVVNGKGAINLAEKDTIISLNKENGAFIKSANQLLTDFGTAGIIDGMNDLGGFPTHNFREGQFDGYQKLDGEALAKSFVVKHESCAYCPVRCKPVVEVEGKYPVTTETGGPEYESIASFGSMCDVNDLAAVCYANAYCNEQGLDTISAGNCVAFAMECYERGLIPKEMLGDMHLRFGNAEDMIRALEAIGSQSGFGKLLSWGVKKCAETLGGETLSFACHVKGQEMAYHEPRSKYGCGMGYAVSPTGADHQHNFNDLNYVQSSGELKYFGLYEPEDPYNLSARKVAMFIEGSGWRHILDSMVLCHFIPWSPAQITEIVNAATGWDMTLYEIVKSGRRILALTRLINMQSGFDENDDILAPRFQEAFTSGPRKGNRIDPDELHNAVQIYYSLLGYDSHGCPTLQLLESLGLDKKPEAI